MTPLKIALIHNLKPAKKQPGLPPDYYSECDSAKTVAAIAAALKKGGHTVFPVEADQRLPRWLSDHSMDLAFNIAEGFEGEDREARVPALMELLEIPYTGSGVLALVLALDKAKTKQIFRSAGIPTPNFQLFQHPDEVLDARLKHPLIVKPNREGSAKGISSASVVHHESALRLQVRQIMEQYRQEALVEEYIEGMELTVGVLGQETILPVLEIDFSECRPSGEFFYSWRMKEYQGDKSLHLVPRFWCPARLSPEVTQAVQNVAWKAAKVLGTRDIARVDIRLSSDGIPYVLEVNPLPGIDPEESNFPIMVRAAGLSYEAFVNQLVGFAVKRSSKLSKSTQAAPVLLEGAASYVPLSNKNARHSAVPVHGTTMPKEIPQTSTGPVPGTPDVPAVTIRNPARPRGKIRNNDPKEGHLGR